MHNRKEYIIENGKQFFRTNSNILETKKKTKVMEDAQFKFETYHCSLAVIFHSFCFENTFKNQINHFLVPEPWRAMNKFKINLNRIDNQKTSTTKNMFQSNKKTNNKTHVLKHWYWLRPFNVQTIHVHNKKCSKSKEQQVL